MFGRIDIVNRKRVGVLYTNGVVVAELYDIGILVASTETGADRFFHEFAGPTQDDYFDVWETYHHPGCWGIAGLWDGDPGI